MQAESKKQEGIFRRHILPIFFILLYLVISLSVFLGLYNMKTEPKIERGLEHLVYPPSGAENVAMIVGIIMLIFVVIAHFLYIRHLKGWTKVIANIVAIILFFGVIEASVRRYLDYHPMLYRPHPTLIWEMNKKDPVSNSKGMRYAEFPDKKEPGEFRFILIGDSSAYGCLIPDGHRFSDILEKKLQERYPRKKIRVINAAVEGYSIVQGRNLFDLKLRHYSPDCLIIAFNNDPNPEIMRDEDRLPPKALRPIFSALYKSELFLVIKKSLINKLLETREGRRIWEKKGKKGDTQRVPPEDVKKHYNYLISAMKEKGGATIIVSMPLPNYEYGNDKKCLKYRQDIENIAKDTNSLFVDIFHEWRNDPNSDRLFLDYVHPNKEGHQKIAECLFKNIIDNKIIEKDAE